MPANSVKECAIKLSIAIFKADKKARLYPPLWSSLSRTKTSRFESAVKSSALARAVRSTPWSAIARHLVAGTVCSPRCTYRRAVKTPVTSFKESFEHARRHQRLHASLLERLLSVPCHSHLSRTVLLVRQTQPPRHSSNASDGSVAANSNRVNQQTTEAPPPPHLR